MTRRWVQLQAPGSSGSPQAGIAAARALGGRLMEWRPQTLAAGLANNLPAGLAQQLPRGLSPDAVRSGLTSFMDGSALRRGLGGMPSFGRGGATAAAPPEAAAAGQPGSAQPAAASPGAGQPAAKPAAAAAQPAPRPHGAAEAPAAITPAEHQQQARVSVTIDVTEPANAAGGAGNSAVVKLRLHLVEAVPAPATARTQKAAPGKPSLADGAKHGGLPGMLGGLFSRSRSAGSAATDAMAGAAATGVRSKSDTRPASAVAAGDSAPEKLLPHAPPLGLPSDAAQPPAAAADGATGTSGQGAAGSAAEPQLASEPAETSAPAPALTSSGSWRGIFRCRQTSELSRSESLPNLFRTSSEFPPSLCKHRARDPCWQIPVRLVTHQRVMELGLCIVRCDCACRSSSAAAAQEPQPASEAPSPASAQQPGASGSAGQQRAAASGAQGAPKQPNAALQLHPEAQPTPEERRALAVATEVASRLRDVIAAVLQASWPATLVMRICI